MPRERRRSTAAGPSGPPAVRSASPLPEPTPLPHAQLPAGNGRVPVRMPPPVRLHAAFDVELRPSGPLHGHRVQSVVPPGGLSPCHLRRTSASPQSAFCQFPREALAQRPPMCDCLARPRSGPSPAQAESQTSTPTPARQAYEDRPDTERPQGVRLLRSSLKIPRFASVPFLQKARYQGLGVRDQVSEISESAHGKGPTPQLLLNQPCSPPSNAKSLTP